MNDLLNQREEKAIERTIFKLKISPQDVRTFSDLKEIMRSIEDQEGRFPR